MKPLVTWVLCAGMVVGALGADDLERCLQQAANSKGAEYVKLRDDILKRGPALQTDLKRTAANVGLTWQQRLVARIWIERLERGKEIESLRRYEWKNDPGFDPRYGSALGLAATLRPLMTKQFKERRLWYYYCEVVVFRTEEQWPMPPGYEWLFKRTPCYGWWASNWGHVALEALRNEPELYYYVEGIREILRGDPELKTELALNTFQTLQHEQIPHAVPELLASFLAYRAGHPMPHPSRIDSMLFHLINMAGPQHAVLFDNFIAAHQEFSLLKPVVDQLRKKPPVKEWEEPLYRPGHPSEAR